MMRPQLYIGGDSMATKVPSHYTESKEIVSGIQKLAYKHPVEQIFQDWLEICAIAVSNSVDWREREDREKRYLMLINKYDREEQQQLVELFAKLADYALVPGVHGVVAGHVHLVEAYLLERIRKAVRDVEKRIARPLAVAGEGALKAAEANTVYNRTGP